MYISAGEYVIFGLAYLGVAVARGRALVFRLAQTSLQADTDTFTHTFS